MYFYSPDAPQTTYSSKQKALLGLLSKPGTFLLTLKDESLFITFLKNCSFVCGGGGGDPGSKDFLSGTLANCSKCISLTTERQIETGFRFCSKKREKRWGGGGTLI